MHLNSFIVEEETGLFLPGSKPESSYSDGIEIEDYLLRAMAVVKDKSSMSQELKSLIMDWPTRYHLSSSRSNLLRPFAFLNRNTRVLELGAGCGALTRYLGEKCGSVDAIEGSYIRAQIARKRCSDLDNVKIYVENFFNLTFNQEYDVVTLIGVLEYAPLFCPDKFKNSEDACAGLLKMATEAVRDDGVIILAIENKLGLKYWAGCKEDHTGKVSEGLHGYPGASSGQHAGPVTFSKKELGDMIRRCGLPELDFYYPFPDYKLPDTILKEDTVYSPADLFLHNWVTTPFEDYSGTREYKVHESLALRNIAKSGLFGDFANSFLILAGKNKKYDTERKWIAKRFSSERKPQFATVTTLYTEPELTVDKVLLDETQQADNHKGPILLKQLHSKWQPGELLSFSFFEAILSDADPMGQIDRLMDSYHENILDVFSTSKKDKDGYPLLRGDSIDYVPWNILVHDGQWFYIDDEWEYEGPLPVDYVLFRSLRHFTHLQQEYMKTNKLFNTDLDAFVLQAIQRMYSQYDWQRNETNKRREEQFQEIVYTSSTSDRLTKLILEKQQLEKRIDSLDISLIDKNETAEKLLLQLKEDTAERDEMIDNLKLTIEERNKEIDVLTEKVEEERVSNEQILNQFSQEMASLSLIQETILSDIATSFRRLTAPAKMIKQFMLCILNPLVTYRTIRDIQAIKHSNLFNPHYYLSNNADVRLSAHNPVSHYYEYGWKEGRNPSSDFDTSYYLNTNPDVRDASINPLVHYIKHGRKEGRRGTRQTVPQYTVQANSVLQEANLCQEMKPSSIVYRKENRILVIEQSIPSFDQDSGSLRMYSILKILTDLKYNVTFLPDNLNFTEPYCSELKNLGIEIINNYLIPEYYIKEKGKEFSVVILSRPDVAFKYLPLIKAYAVTSKVIYDTVDLHWLRYQRAYELYNNQDLKKQAYYYNNIEIANARCSDVTFTVTEEDRKHLLDAIPDVDVKVVPNIHEIEQVQNGFNNRYGLMFIGGFYHEPNVDAVLYFVNEIYPSILKKLPGIKLYVVGSNPPEKIRALDGPDIKVTGFLKDVRPIFQSCRVFVSALRYGAGMKGKIGQSMSFGLPVVTTSIGAEGMGLTDGQNALIADRPQAFADAVVRLYLDEKLWNKVSRSSIDHIAGNYSSKIISEKIKEILHSLQKENLRDFTEDTKNASNQLIPDQRKKEEGLLLGNEDISSVTGFTLPCFDNPLVSIIIPIYNNWRMTYNCIRSIMINTNTSSVSYEIIAANDASKDETAEMLSKISNIKVLTNIDNMGFLKNCNNAAKYAKGKYILFLNNDTYIMENCLKLLAETIEKSDDIGIVGGMLLNSDGTIQEAGGIIWKDGWGWPYGKDDQAEKYEYNYVKEVDCIIGACFMIRANLFSKARGFDERYAPAFYEEFDLEFNIQEMGYKVIYQPKAKIIHYDSSSYGTAIRNKLSNVNHKKFCDKWQHRLSKQYQSRSDLFLAREHSINKNIILFVEDRIPEYDIRDCSLITFQHINLFHTLGLKVILFADNLEKKEPYTSELQQIGIEVIYNSFNFDDWIEKNGIYINYVWFSQPDIANKYLEKLRKNTSAKIFYYTRYFNYIGEKRLNGLNRDSLQNINRLKEIEKDLFNNVDVIFTQSDKEIKVIKNIISNKRVNTITPYFYKSTELISEYSLDQRNGLLLLCDFKYIPNVNAVDWFMASILPRIRKRIPDIVLYIVGNNPPKRFRDCSLNRIIVTENIKDQYFQIARVFVYPLQYGEGLQGKILTSLRYGLPIVTTSVGNNGINLKDGCECLIANTPEEFAEKVLDLYFNKNLWEKLSANSQQTIGNNILKEKVEDNIKSMILI